MSELVSPFDLDEPESIAQKPELTDADLVEIENLLEETGIAKKEAEVAKVRYDVLRERIGGLLRRIGKNDIENDAYKASIRENKSDYSFSDKVKQAEKQLKLMQDVEKRHGIAVPRKTTRTVVFTENK